MSLLVAWLPDQSRLTLTLQPAWFQWVGEIRLPVDFDITE